MINEELINMLKKFYGKPPYNNFCNICYRDGIYMKSIESKYKPEDILKAINIIKNM